MLVSMMMVMQNAHHAHHLANFVITLENAQSVKQTESTHQYVNVLHITSLK